MYLCPMTAPSISQHLRTLIEATTVVTYRVKSLIKVAMDPFFPYVYNHTVSSLWHLLSEWSNCIKVSCWVAFV